jgi:hypothetical protein
VQLSSEYNRTGANATERGFKGDRGFTMIIASVENNRMYYVRLIYIAGSRIVFDTGEARHRYGDKNLVVPAARACTGIRIWPGDTHTSDIFRPVLHRARAASSFEDDAASHAVFGRKPSILMVSVQSSQLDRRVSAKIELRRKCHRSSQNTCSYCGISLGCIGQNQAVNSRY